jgi:hypothetical protein
MFLVTREETGIQDPVRTLRRASGSKGDDFPQTDITVA